MRTELPEETMPGWRGREVSVLVADDLDFIPGVYLMQGVVVWAEECEPHEHECTLIIPDRGALAVVADWWAFSEGYTDVGGVVPWEFAVHDGFKLWIVPWR